MIFFQPLMTLSENWSIVACITNLGWIHEKLSYRSHKVKLLTQKSEKIGHFDFFSAIIEIVGELLFNTMHNKFEEVT